MKGTARRTCIGLLALISIAIVGTALAWACSPGNRITIANQVPAPASGPPGAGPSGTEVTLHGEQFLAGETVEIYWNELGDGPLLARFTVPDGSTTFTTDPITIPRAPADTHTIVARTENAEGQVFTARTSFTVTKPGAPASGGGPGTEPGPTSPPTTRGQTSPAPRSGGAGTRVTAGGGRARGGGRDSATVTGPATARSPESNRSPAGPVSPGTGGGVSPGPLGNVSPGRGVAITGRSDTPAVAGSAAPPASPGASRDSGSPRDDGAGGSPGGARIGQGAASTDPSASGDLWGGFSSASARPGLSGAADPAEDGTSSSMTVGLGMLGFGLVALFTGFGAAHLRRRRRLASASSQRRSRQS